MQMETVRAEARNRFDDTIEFDYIFVDDGSTDRTIAVVLAQIERNDRIKLVELSRNFGKEAALTAGSTRPMAMRSCRSTLICRTRPSSSST